MIDTLSKLGFYRIVYSFKQKERIRMGFVRDLLCNLTTFAAEKAENSLCHSGIEHS